MKDFGFNIHKDKQFDADEADTSLYKKLLELCPEVSTCISCASCSAACTSRSHPSLMLHEIILHLRRGDRHPIENELINCLMCGKCILLCPRNINTRKILLTIRKLINNA